MHLHRDWRRILAHAWSVRLMLIAVLFEIGAAVAPILSDGSVLWTAILTGIAGIFTAAALFARIVAQKEFENGR